MPSNKFQRLGFPNELDAILSFAIEVEALKNVLRQSPVYDFSRRENSAEHSWEVALLALLFADFSDFPIDISRVVKMLLIHDIVEVTAGDTFVYDESAAKTQAEREKAAAHTLFGILPSRLGTSLHALWNEFEEAKTNDARFAKAMDRWQPLLHNYVTQGGTWRLPDATPEKVFHAKKIISFGSAQLWDAAQLMIADGLVSGYFNNSEDQSIILAACDQRLLAISRYFRGSLPNRWQASADECELRYGINFSTLTLLPNKLLTTLHKSCIEPNSDHLYIASAHNPEVSALVDSLGNMAEVAATGKHSHDEYLKNLIEIYKTLPLLMAKEDTVWIAPRREGHLIASCIRNTGHDITLAPHAKRIIVPEGILVGLTELDIPEETNGISIIDGAIASGATLMAIMNSLPRTIERVHIIAAHATSTSINCLLVYAARTGLNLHLSVGHVSGVLNDKYYAVETKNSRRLIVGDLGDLTSDAHPLHSI